MISWFPFRTHDSQYFEIGYIRRGIPWNDNLIDTTLGSTDLSQWLCYKEKEMS